MASGTFAAQDEAYEFTVNVSINLALKSAEDGEAPALHGVGR